MRCLKGNKKQGWKKTRRESLSIPMGFNNGDKDNITSNNGGANKSIDSNGDNGDASL